MPSNLAVRTDSEPSTSSISASFASCRPAEGYGPPLIEALAAGWGDHEQLDSFSASRAAVSQSILPFGNCNQMSRLRPSSAVPLGVPDEGQAHDKPPRDSDARSPVA